MLDVMCLQKFSDGQHRVLMPDVWFCSCYPHDPGKHDHLQYTMQSSLFSISMTIGLVGRVFTNGPGIRVSIPGRVIPKTQKMLLDASLINTQYYMVWINGKWSSVLP